jgi:lipopolysaccharide export system protein LptA
MKPLPLTRSFNSVAVIATLLLVQSFHHSLQGQVVDGLTSSPPLPKNDSLVTIESDIQQADNQTGIVTATGNVRITYPDKGMVATSRQAQYFSKEGRLVLSGDVDVIDADGQRIRADRLVYQLDQERLLAKPAQGKQVMSKLKLNTPSPQKEADLIVP